MSNIDNRVVQMRFENGQFESGVKTSMSTIEKLKQALQFKGADKGLSNISSAAKNVNLNPIGNAVESVGLKFSAMQVMATTALANITNSAVNAGKRIVSALTIDPIKSGFQEYETQINAIQTVLANTESKGTTLGDVNAALDELNKYADKTIYNFTEMTRNIGTFTAAGVDLETSVSSIKGIANLAAVSGSTSQQASTAMYQLSQALASGTVKLMDWNSVVNAGMGGEVFQTALKRTAKNFGINVDAMIEKYGSFRETLTKEEWLTSEVLTETLSQIAGAYSESDLLAKGYTQEQTDQILKLAKTGEEAATKVKTFTQLIDTTKEALQSGWTQTWETIVGDFEGAKSFWTSIGDSLSKSIGESADRRNTFLEKAMSSNWDKLVKEVNEAGIETADFEKQVRASAESLGYEGEKIDKLVEHYGSLGEAFKAGAISSRALKDAMKELTGASVDLSLITGDLKKGDNGEDVRQAQKALKALGYDIGTFGKDLDGLDGKLGSVTESAIKAFQKAEGLKVTGIVDEETLAALDKANKKTQSLSANIDEYIANIKELGGQDLLHDALQNILNFVLSVTGTIGKAWREIFDFKPEGLYNAIKAFNELTQGLEMSKQTADNLKRTFKGVFAILDIIATLTGSVLKYAFKGLSAILSAFDLDILGFTGNLGDALVALRDWIDAHDVVGMAIEKIGIAIGAAIKFVSHWIEVLKQSPEVQAAFEKISGAVSDTFGKIKEHFSDAATNFAGFIERVKSLDSISLDNIKKMFVDFKDNVLKPFFNFNFDFGTIKTAISNFKNTLATRFEDIGKIFDWFREKGGQLVEFLKDAFPAAIAVAVGAIVALGVYKLGGALETLGGILAAPAEFLETVGDAFTNIAKGIKFKNIAEGVKSLAMAVLILVGAIAILANIKTENLVPAIIGLVVIMGALAGLAFLMSKVTLPDAASFLGLSVAITALSAGLLILVLSIKLLESMDLNKALGNAAILLGLVVVLGGIAAALAAFGSGVAKGAGGMLLVAVALGAFVLVLKMMANVDPTTLLKAMPAFVLIMSSLVAILVAMGSAGQYAAKAGVAILAISVALHLMIGAIKRLAKIDSASLLMALPAFITIMGMVALLMIATKLAGEHALKAGVAIVAVAGALLLITAAIKNLGEIDSVSLMNATAVISTLMVIFSLVIAASHLAGEHAIKAGLMLLMMSGALMILVGAIAIIKNMKSEGLWEAVGVIAILEALFAGLIAVTHFAKDGIGTLVMLTVAVGVLVGLISVLTLLDQEKLRNSTACLSMLMGMFALLVASTKVLGKLKLGKTLVTLGALALIVAGLAGVLKKLGDIKVESSLASAGAISLLLLSLAATCVIVSFAGSSAMAAMPAMVALVAIVAGLGAILIWLNACDMGSSVEIAKDLANLLLELSVVCGILALVGLGGPAALIGVASLAALVAAMAGVIAGLGALYKDGKNYDKGIEVLTKCGEAIGGFVGGIVSGFGVAATKDLPKIGASLSSFMGSIQPFLTYSKGIDDGLLDRIGTLTKAILLLTAADFISGIKSFGDDSSPFENLKTNLPMLGKGLADFTKELEGVNLDALDIGAKAIEALAKMTIAIPKEGGLMQDILGTSDMQTFAGGISAFGGAIKSYAESVSGLNDDDLTAMENATEAGVKLAQLEGKIPKKGGWAQDIMGSSELEEFGKGIKAFGKAIVGYSESVSGLTDDNLASMDAATDAGVKLADLEGKIPESGGWAQTIMGEQDLATFGLSLNAFGKCLVDYAKTVADITEDDADKITQSAKVGEKLAELEGKIPEADGWAQKIMGEQDLATFGSKLVTFGTGIRDFAAIAATIDEGAITSVDNVGKIIDAIKPILEKIPESGGWWDAIAGAADHGSFGQGLINLAKGIKDYLAIAATITEDSVTSINNTKDAVDALLDVMSTVTEGTDGDAGAGILNATNNLTLLMGVINGLATTDYSGLTSLKEALTGVSGECIDGFVEVFSTSGDKVKTAVDTFLTNIITAMEGYDTTFQTVGETLVGEFANGVTSETSLSTAQTAVETLSTSAAEGIDTESFSSAGAACVDGFASGITANTFKAQAAAAAMAAAALAAAEAELGINSPSKEFMKDGEYSAEGYVIGLEKYSSVVEKAGYTLGDRVIAGMKDGLGTRRRKAIFDVLGQKLARLGQLPLYFDDLEPTIRPVVDLSNVTASSSIIDRMLGITPSASVLSDVDKISVSMNRHQNRADDNVVSAINDLKRSIDNAPRNSYQINGITYDDGSNVSSAIETLVRAANVERRK